MQDLPLAGKKVLLRLDINSPLTANGHIANDNRIRQPLPTIRYLLTQGAAVCIIAHQGDTLDYHNLVSLRGHAAHLSKLLQQRVHFIDDIAGPAARESIARLPCGQVLMLENLRFLSEELSTFEDEILLSPQQMRFCYLVRNLAPLFDFYINDAFSAAHRNCPSMVAFQQLLPSAAGFLFMEEVRALHAIVHEDRQPSVFLLGGLKVADVFAVVEQVLQREIADTVLIAGLTGIILLKSLGYSIEEKYLQPLVPRHSLKIFLAQSTELLKRFPDRLYIPLDLAYEEGERKEAEVTELPGDTMFKDIGERTIAHYAQVIAHARKVFVNGPAGVFEDPLFMRGTHALWEAVADSKGFTVIGGGDSVNAATHFIDLKKINYVSTAGGAMTRYVAGRPLPLMSAMSHAREALTALPAMSPPVEVNS